MPAGSKAIAGRSPADRRAAPGREVTRSDINGPRTDAAGPRLSFTNEYGSGSFYLGVIRGDNPLDVRLLGTLGFVLPGKLTPTSYSLAEAWAEEKGAIVLLGAQAANPRTLAGEIEKTLLDETGVRLVWIANPDALPSRWIRAIFPLRQDGEKRVLKRDVEMEITGEPGGYRFHFNEGLAIGIDAARDSLVFGDGIAQFGRGSARFGAESMRTALANVTGPAFTFDFTVPGGHELVKGLDALGLGLWYSRQQVDGGRVAFRYPFFETNQKHGRLDCSARITPAALLEPVASRIDAYSPGEPAPYYTTWLRTVFDRRVLAQAPEFAMLFNATQPGSYGLSPEGRFSLRFSNRAEDEARLKAADLDRSIACGGSGTERIVVAPALEDSLKLELKAGRPSAARDGDDTLSLADDTTTAWMRISASDKLVYEAQPDGQAAMYLATGMPESKVPLMPFLPLQAAIIPPEPAAQLLPMVPLAGLTGPTRDAAITLETAAIAPARKAQLGVADHAGNAAAESPSWLLPANMRSGVKDAAGDEQFTAITPRGLEANFTRTANGDRWDSVQIARLLKVLPDNDGKLRFAGANGIVEPLLSALLTSQQFLVVSDPAAIKPFFSGDDAKVTLAGWEFLLDPDQWVKRGTILILKNTPVAMQALLGDLGSWTSASAFNRNPAATSRQLLSIAAEAREAVKTGQEQFAAITGELPENGEQDLKFFVETVLDSPNWNGFLFLSAQLGSIPKDLAGMRAGITPGQLYVHHLGVTQTPFTTLADLQNRSSSMFGLIRYYDTNDARGNGLAYDFRVRELGVRFVDSDIRDFRATVELSFGPVFGQRATLDGGPAVATMMGVRHRRGTGDSYTFTTLGKIELKLGNGPLSRVDIEQGEFITMSVAAEPGGLTRTAFNFAGSLVFLPVTSGDEVYDILSFDALAFSDLSVRMEFANDQPQKPTYKFLIDDLQLSEARSKARKRSLYEGMPLKLDALIEGSAKPDTLGNMNVQLPMPAVTLPARWYGVTQTLDLGTLSDVAGAAGLEAKLLTAWGPAPGQYYVGLNISGPGLSGAASELSLLGVLKLKVYALKLRHHEGQWTMLLQGVTLGVFSKTLPPGGAFEFYVFGVPDPSGSANSLGWYGAWLADQKKKPELAGSPPLLAGAAQSDAASVLPLISASPRLRFRSPSQIHSDSQGD
jgi:hypothetical protein